MMKTLRNKIWLLVLWLLLCTVQIVGATAPGINPRFTAISSTGAPWYGAQLYTYVTGTTTPKTTWTNATKGTPNANPIILDQYGQADVWLDSSTGGYRLRLVDPEGVEIWTKDSIYDSAGVASETVAGVVRQSTNSEIEAGSNITAFVAPDQFKKYNGFIDSVSALKLRQGYDGEVLYLRYHTSPEDGGHGVFYWDSDSVLADDNGATIAVTGVATGRWVRQLNGFVTPEMFGGDVQAAIDYVEANITSMSTIDYSAPYLLLDGTYYVGVGLTITKPISIKGAENHTNYLWTDQNITILTTNLSHSFQYVGETVENVTFIGNGTGSNQNGVVCGSKAGIHTYRNCQFLYMGNNGFRFNGGATLVFEDNRVFYNRAEGVVIQGIELSASGYVTWSSVKRNACSYNKIGMWLKGQIGSTEIQGNLFESNNIGSGAYGSATRPGIGLYCTKYSGGTDFQNLTKSKISGNYFEDNWCGFYAESMSYTDIDDKNHFDTNHPSTITYGSSDGSVFPHAQIAVASANTSQYCTIKNNFIGILNQQIGTTFWSVTDATTINVAYTGYADILRFKSTGYLLCGSTGVSQKILGMTDNTTSMDITVSSTTGFNTAQTLFLYIPQCVGFNGASQFNLFEGNTFTMPAGVTYVDPDGVYDGQALVIGSKGVRVGLSSSAIGDPNARVVYGWNQFNGIVEVKRNFPIIKMVPTIDSNSNIASIQITGPSSSDNNQAFTFSTSAGGATNGVAYINKNGDLTAAAMSGANGGAGIDRGGMAFIKPSGGFAYIYFSTAAPTTGQHTIGSMVFNSAPAIGSPKGWVCTVTGTPGTWVPMDNL